MTTIPTAAPIGGLHLQPLAKPKKQAVVVIHGIGEQRPLETLRSFVDAVYARDPTLTPNHLPLDDPKSARMKLDDGTIVNRTWAVPDATTGSAELRRITTRPSISGVRTDFYEFYWADIMDGTPLELVTGWVRGLLIRSPLDVPRRTPVILAWLMLWALTIVFAIFAIAIADAEHGWFSLVVTTVIGALAAVRWPLFVVLTGGGGALVVFRLLQSAWKGFSNRASPAAIARPKIAWPLGIAVLGVVLFFLLPVEKASDPRLWASVLTAATGALISGVMVPYVGDIARFVKATPSTVLKRKEVRDRGIALLTALHDAVDPITGDRLYDRVVIFSHSLGTIVAYDILQHFWEDRGPNHKRPPMKDPQVLAAFKKVDAFVQKSWAGGASGAGELPFDLPAFRLAQAELQQALVAANEGWLISDFITVGSPLVHAEFLMSDNRIRMRQEFVERILSASPPRPDYPTNSMLYNERRGGQQLGPFVHFAAPFSTVRWTNIYDYDWFPLFGDLISGPLSDIFGAGIEEHRVRMTRGWGSRFFTHTLYWTLKPTDDPHNPPEHIALIRKALAL